MGYSEFKSKFVQYFLQYENTKSKIESLKSALDRAVEIELPSRDKNKTFQIRDITNSEKLRISYDSQFLMCNYSNKKDRVLVGTIAPAWDRGWKNFSKDDFVSDQINTFFYFANQFVYRGYQINLIGAIALTYGRACDFRGNEINYYLLPVCNSYYHSFHNDISVNKSKRNQRLAYYIELLN